MSETNSPLVDILLELGAVIYVKTNIPQTLMVSLPFTEISEQRLLTSYRLQTPITTYLDVH
jgi:hypothetical protein